MIVNNKIIVRAFRTTTLITFVQDSSILVNFTYNRKKRNFKKLENTLKFLIKNYDFNLVTIKIVRSNEDTDELINIINQSGMSIMVTFSDT